MTPDNEAAPAAADAHPSDNVPVETVSVTPLVVAKEAPAAEVTEAIGETDKGNEAAPESAPGTRKPPKLDAWAQKLVDDAQAKARIAERESKRLAEELAASKTQKPEPVTPTSTPADDEAARAAAPVGGYKTQAEFDTAVAAEATRREAEARQNQSITKFNQDADAAYAKGVAAFPGDFDAAVKNLQSVGVMNKDFLDLVLAIDEPHKVLYELGTDPNKATALLAMPMAQRAIEIAKLAVGAPKPATPTPLSKAPRPVSPVDGSAKSSAEPSDDDSDEVFFAKREAQLRAQRVG